MSTRTQQQAAADLAVFIDFPSDADKGINSNNNGELHSPADRLLNSRSELEKAKKQGLSGLRGSKNTRMVENGSGATPNFAGTDGDNATEGILSAEAILSHSTLAPTGTQAVNALTITDSDRQSFLSLNQLRLGEVHQRLAKFVPLLQAAFGSRASWPGAFCAQGTYAFLDPLLLSAYIPYVEETSDLSDEQVIDCFHPFSVVDGYPVIGGVPIWERQEWERIEYYNVFKLYRDMRYAFYNEADQLVANRSMATLAKAIRVPTRIVLYLSKVYNWDLRTSLYDSWMAEQQQKRNVVRQRLMMDRHSKISQALIQKAFTALNKNAEKMSPKEALEMLRLGLQYERLSAGLPPDKPEGTAATSGTHVSIVNQTNNAGGPMQVNTGVGDGAIVQQLQDNMKKPDTLLSVLSVLQRSNAFNTLLSQANKEAEEGVIDIEPTDVNETPEAAKAFSAEGSQTPERAQEPAAKAPPGTPGFAFNEVPREPISGRGPDL
jgi:hypothetical protein